MDNMQLGGNIELEGFSAFDRGTMVILKKMIGNFVRKVEDKCSDFQQLKVSVNPVPQTEGVLERFELKAHVIDGEKEIHGESVEQNVFVGINAVLKKIENGL